MKRLFGLIALLCLTLSVSAQSADEVAFREAKRNTLRLKNAEGYTLSVKLFGAPQTISVVKFSPKHYSLGVIQPEVVTKVSEVGETARAHFAINACYWAVSISKPTTYVKSYGANLSETHPASLPRVNGLMFMYDRGIEIVRSTDIPDYPSLEDKCNACENIIACGPVLIDDGEVISYRDITESTAEDMKRKKLFYIRRHPRSAVGCDAEGNIYMVVVDGRSKGNAEGMSIAELTQLCSWLGMVEAMNLDGGGSSALWSKKYGVLNHPCDNRKFDHEGERKVSSTLVAKLKR